MEQTRRPTFRSSSGFALAVVLLVATVALVAATSAATIAAVSGRSITVQERRATDAQLAAESGLNTFVALSRSTGLFSAGSTYVAGDVSAWLAANNGARASATFANNAGFTLQAFETADSNEFTLRSTGTAPGGSRQVVLQDFRVSVTARNDSIGSAGALVTQQGFGTQGNATITGRSSNESDWIWTGAELRDGFVGEYFVITQADGTKVTYRITSRSANGEVFSLETLAGDELLPAPNGGTTGDLIPFAVAEDVTVSAATTTFAVSTTVLYTPGMTIFVGDAEGMVTAVDFELGTITVEWAGGWTGDIDEATPIRARVPSAVFDDGRFVGDDTDIRYIVLPDDECPVSGAAELTDGCAVADLSNLWSDTFGTLDPADMLGLARCDPATLSKFTSSQLEYLFGPFCENSYYGPDPSVDPPPVSEWPTTLLEGVTWIDGANTGAFNSRGGGRGNNPNDTSGRAICGSGVVVLNTGVYAAGDEATASVNLNVSDCEFSGVLYVIGDVSIQGNLDSFNGTIIVETADTTNVRGTSGDGSKATYDPVAVRRALNQLPRDFASELRVVALPVTFRFGQ